MKYSAAATLLVTSVSVAVTVGAVAVGDRQQPCCRRNSVLRSSAGPIVSTMKSAAVSKLPPKLEVGTRAAAQVARSRLQ